MGSTVSGLGNVVEVVREEVPLSDEIGRRGLFGFRGSITIAKVGFITIGSLALIRISVTDL